MTRDRGETVPARDGPTRRYLAVASLWSLTLAVVALGPALAPGHLLSYDLVTVPRQDLLPASLGLGDALPRAVPVDALVAVGTTVVPGSVLVKAVLLAALVAAGVGAAVLVPVGGAWSALLASTVMLWNPYVAERLVLGHWALLVAYATLPWVMRTAVALRTHPSRTGLAVMVLLLAAAAITPTGGIVAASLGLAVLAWPGDGPGSSTRVPWVAGVAGVAVVVNAPWWVPAMLVDALPPDPAGVQAFAARSEAVALLPTLLGLGGTWNAEVVPVGRGQGLVVVASAVLMVVLAGLGWPALRARLGPGVWGLAGVAVAGLVVAWVSALPPVSGLLADHAGLAPLGLLRDAAKYLGPLALLWAVTVPAGAARLARATGRPRVAMAFVPSVLVAQLLLLPGLAWGVGGRLTTVDYPSDWEQVRSALLEAPDRGDAVSLPWGAFRRFDWATNTVLDPVPRYLPVTVVHADDLPVGGRVVRGESRRARQVAAALGTGRPAVDTLPPLGVGWVAVASRTPGPEVDPALLEGAEPVVTGESLTLLRLPGPVAPTGPPGWTTPVLVADGVAGGLLLAAAGVLVLDASRGRRRHRGRSVLESRSA